VGQRPHESGKISNLIGAVRHSLDARAGDYELWAVCGDAYRLFVEASDQVLIGGMGGYVGPDLMAVKMIAETIGIEWGHEILTLVRACFAAFYAKEWSKSIEADIINRYG
jgi:hypothetical protein